MDYQKLVSRAWEIVSKHRYLWWLGFMATFSFGSTAHMYNWPGPDSASNTLSTANTTVDQLLTTLTNWIQVNWSVFLLLLFLFLLLLVALLYIASVARAGLILAAEQYNEKKETKLTFRTAYRHGRPYAWRVLGLSVIRAVAIMVLLVVPLFLIFLIGVMFTSDQAGLLALLLFASLFALIAGAILSALTTMVVNLAEREIVLHKATIPAAIHHAERMVVKQFVPTFLTWLIGVMVQVAGSLVLGISLVLLAIVLAVFVAIAIVAPVGVGVLIFIFMICLSVALTVVILYLVGGITAWESVYWTLAYNEIKQLKTV